MWKLMARSGESFNEIVNYTLVTIIQRIVDFNYC